MHPVLQKILGGLAIAAAVTVVIVLVEKQQVEKIGEPCSEEGYGHCWGPEKRRIACLGGKWVEEPCRGPDGCSGRRPATCDTSANIEGDVCAPGVPRCAPGGRSVLVCRDHRLVSQPCTGGCVPGKPAGSRCQ